MLAAVAFCNAWLLSAGAVWLYLHQVRHATTAQYRDIVIPTRWPRLRASLGDHYIAEAEIFVRHGDIARAVHLLHAGIARSPANHTGRLLLAEIYASNRRPDLAADVLENGLRPAPEDREYIRKVLRFFLEQHEDARLGKVCAELLRLTRDESTRAEIALFAATAAYAQNHFKQARRLIEVHQLEPLPDAILLLARMDRESGYPDLALARLDALLGRQPAAETDATYKLAAEITSQLGRSPEIERRAREQIARRPFSPAPYLDLLQLYQQTRDETRLQRELTSYFLHFESDAPALLRLAEFATNAGRPEVVQRIQDVARRHAQPTDALVLMFAESQVVAGRPRECLEILRHLRAESPSATDALTGPISGLRVVAFAALGRSDEARLHLDHLLADKQVSSQTLTALAHRLVALDAFDFAHPVLLRAVALDPRNTSALVALVRLEIDRDKTAGLPAHVRALLAARKPSRETLALAQSHFGSDRQLFLPEQSALLAELEVALRPPGRNPD